MNINFFANAIISHTFLNVSLTGVLALALLGLFHVDVYIIKKLSSLFVVSHELMFWLYYFLSALVLMVINIYLSMRALLKYPIGKNDWKTIWAFVYRVQAFKDFRSGNIVNRSVPKYAVIFLLVIFFSGFFIALSKLIVNPFIECIKHGNVPLIEFNVGDLTSVFLISIFPPFMLIYFWMWIKSWSVNN